jgi:hypothetical protein
MRGVTGRLLLLCICAGLLGATGWSEERRGSVSQRDGSAEASVEGWRLLPTPIAFYSADTGWGAGAGVTAFRENEDGSQSYSRFIGIYTQKNQVLLGLGADLKLVPSARAVVADLEFRKWPTAFFGTGPDSEREDEEIYTPLGSEIALGYRWPLWRDLSITPSYSFSGYDIVEREDRGLLEGADIRGSGGSVSTGPGVEVRWDSRDEEIYPRTGLYAAVELHAYPGFLGSSQSSGGFLLDYRQFVTIAGSHVLAWQASAEAALGEAPLLDYPGLGGPNMLRGYLDGRFRDLLALALQAEYRFPLFWRFRGAVFAAAGRVGADTAELLRPGGFRPTVGGGVRFRLLADQEFALRLDYAYSPEGGQVYFAFNEAF